MACTLSRVQPAFTTNLPVCVSTFYQLCASKKRHFCPFHFAKQLKVGQNGLIGSMKNIFQVLQQIPKWFYTLNTWLMYWFKPKSHFVGLLVCLCFLSCWETNLLLSFKFFVASSRFSNRTIVWFAPFSFPWLLKEKHSHRMILPSPCFIMEICVSTIHSILLVDQKLWSTSLVCACVN